MIYKEYLAIYMNIRDVYHLNWKKKCWEKKNLIMKLEKSEAKGLICPTSAKKN